MAKGQPVSAQLGTQGEQYLAMLKVHNSKVNNIQKKYREYHQLRI